MGHSRTNLPVFEQGLHDATAAIDRLIDLAGGPTALGIRVRTSGQSIANLRVARRVSNSVLAHLMADVAEELGEPSITSRVLSGVEEWDRAGVAGQGRRAKKGSAGSARSNVVTPIAPPAEAGAGVSQSLRKPRRTTGGRTSSRCVVRRESANANLRVVDKLVGTRRA